MSDSQVIIAAFYRFVPLPDFELMRDSLKEFCIEQGMKGTILLAKEGINATVAGSEEAIDALFERFNKDSRLSEMPHKRHIADFQPFERMKVRLKQEIVRMAIDHLDVSERGQYVDAEAWDALLEDPEVVTIDTRNNYEVKLGTFEGAINPKTNEFRSFPKWAEENLDPRMHKKVAMFCTGGIRCEKSTALLKNMGFDEVYHLNGGILQYLKDTKNRRGKWKGKCFVFDERVTVNDALEPDRHNHCDDCGQPLSCDDVKWLNGGESEELICRDCVDEQNGSVEGAKT